MELHSYINIVNSSHC